MSAPLHVAFRAGASGRWRVDAITGVVGASLPAAMRLDLVEAPVLPSADGADWILRGMTSNARYAHRVELDRLALVQEGLGRSSATRAALIAIRKSEAWWALAQDERRAIFEEQSRHVAIGLEYLPAVARRLHHARDLGEPFDFLTWFEYAPEDAAAFETMVSRLRLSPEWHYVDREVDIRLSRQSDASASGRRRFAVSSQQVVHPVPSEEVEVAKPRSPRAKTG
ncbi:Chlorite dismutase [Bosea sp. CRIB-10]|nr:Chlorite dismutase [Bosea sp. CRIB-10]